MYCVKKVQVLQEEDKQKETGKEAKQEGALSCFPRRKSLWLCCFFPFCSWWGSRSRSGRQVQLQWCDQQRLRWWEWTEWWFLQVLALTVPCSSVWNRTHKTNKDSNVGLQLCMVNCGVSLLLSNASISLPLFLEMIMICEKHSTSLLTWMWISCFISCNSSIILIVWVACCLKKCTISKCLNFPGHPPCFFHQQNTLTMLCFTSFERDWSNPTMTWVLASISFKSGETTVHGSWMLHRKHTAKITFCALVQECTKRQQWHSDCC